MLLALLHTRSINTTVVLLGDVRLTRRSPIQVWLITRPVRSMSEIEPTPLTFKVEVITPGEPLE